jgi:hypothetical protein
VTIRPPAQRIAEHLIRRACRRLRGDLRDERYREWAAELPPIFGDPDIRFAFLRSARALRYAAGVSRSARHLPRAASAPAWGARQPAIFPRPDGVIPAIAAVATWVTILALARAFPAAITSPGPWHPLLMAVPILPAALGALAVIRFLRWLRRRSRQAPDP